MTRHPEHRPVWLSDADAASLASLAYAHPAIARLLDRYEAAPADATSLIAEAYLDLMPDEAREQAMALLRALGMPLGGGDAD